MRDHVKPPINNISVTKAAACKPNLTTHVFIPVSAFYFHTYPEKSAMTIFSEKPVYAPSNCFAISSGNKWNEPLSQSFDMPKVFRQHEGHCLYRKAGCHQESPQTPGLMARQAQATAPGPCPARQLRNVAL
jgi:hypothetical protein